MPGVAAYGAIESRRWVEHAADVGAHSVLLLPPNVYRADRAAVVQHYRIAAEVGSRRGLQQPLRHQDRPALLAASRGLHRRRQGVHCDVRRAYEINELAPSSILSAPTTCYWSSPGGCGGLIAGYPNAPRPLELYNLATSGDAADNAKALPMYRDPHPLPRWDSRPSARQVKLSMDLAGRKGGQCRPPRSPLAPEVVDQITADTKAALAKGYR
jgi:4-hydroxy-tetrahydrodipicolinate synthase